MEWQTVPVPFPHGRHLVTPAQPWQIVPVPLPMVVILSPQPSLPNRTVGAAGRLTCPSQACCRCSSRSCKSWLVPFSAVSSASVAWWAVFSSSSSSCTPASWLACLWMVVTCLSSSLWASFSDSTNAWKWAGVFCLLLGLRQAGQVLKCRRFFYFWGVCSRDLFETFWEGLHEVLPIVVTKESRMFTCVLSLPQWRCYRNFEPLVSNTNVHAECGRPWRSFLERLWLR